MIMNFELTICFVFVIVLIWPTNAQIELDDESSIDSNNLDPNYVDEDGNTQLMLLARAEQNRTSEMVYLLNNGARTNINAKNNHGQTAVYLAAKEGNLDHVRTLLSYGADIHTSIPKYGETILQKAITGDPLFARSGPLRGSNLGVVRLLIEKGANVTGSLPLLFSQEDWEDAAKIRHKIHYENTGVAHDLNANLASTKLNETNEVLEIAKLLLAKGIDVDETVGVQDDLTALCMAANLGNIKFVKFLVENGADVDHIHHNGHEPGWTPILTAAEGMTWGKSWVGDTMTNHSDVVDYLIEIGADLTVTTPNTGFNLTTILTKAEQKSYYYCYEESNNCQKKVQDLKQKVLAKMAKNDATDNSTLMKQSDFDREEKVCTWPYVATKMVNKLNEIANALNIPAMEN